MLDTLSPWLFWAVLAPGTVVVAGAISAGLIVRLRPVLARYALAPPNARSSHSEPTPQGGGIAVIAATIATTALALLITGRMSAVGFEVLGIMAGAGLIAVVGAADDIRTIEVMPRLALQALAVGIVIATLPSDLSIFPIVPQWLERLLLLIGGMWFVNLVNFMDGIDWMTVAEVVPISTGLVFIGLLGALPSEGLVVALALGGALVGFAPFNRPVARLFLGDVGSLPIGLLLGWLLILLAGQGHVAAALILPLYYLADATITLLQRLARGEPFWRAHRTHFYQRATDRGFGVSEIVARVFAVNLVLVGLAIATVLAPSRANSAAALACAAALVGWLLFSFARGKP